MVAGEIQLDKLGHSVIDGLTLIVRGFSFGDISGILLTLEGASVVHIVQDDPEDHDDSVQPIELLQFNDPILAIRTVQEDALAEQALINFRNSLQIKS